MFWVGLVVGVGIGAIGLGAISCVMISRDEKELMEEFNKYE